MVQKSFSEAMRSLVLYTASWQDRVQIAEHNGETDELAMRVNDLLLPDREGLRLGAFVGAARHRVAADLRRVRLPDRSTRSSSTSATPRSTPSTRAPRRSRARTSSSARSSRTRPRRSASSPARSSGFINSEAGNGRLKVERELLAKALEDAQALVGLMINTLMSADESAEGGDIRNIYKVGLNTSRLLMVLGDVVCAWLLLKGAEVALEKLSGEVSAQRQGVLRGQGRGRAVLRALQPAQAHRRAGHRRGDRPVPDGPRRGRLLILA